MKESGKGFPTLVDKLVEPGQVGEEQHLVEQGDQEPRAGVQGQVLGEGGRGFKVFKIQEQRLEPEKPSITDVRIPTKKEAPLPSPELNKNNTNNTENQPKNRRISKTSTKNLGIIKMFEKFQGGSPQRNQPEISHPTPHNPTKPPKPAQIQTNVYPRNVPPLPPSNKPPSQPIETSRRKPAASEKPKPPTLTPKTTKTIQKTRKSVKTGRNKELEAVLRQSDMRKYVQNRVELPEIPNDSKLNSNLFLKTPLKPATKEDQDRPADHQTKSNGLPEIENIAKGIQY